MTDSTAPAPQDFFAAVAEIGEVEVLDVAAMELLYRLECSGEDFYTGLAERVGNERAAELLRRNGKEERGHAERIGRAIAIRQGHAFEPTAELETRFAVPLPDEISAELFPVIVQAEIDGDAGYQRWADRESDPEVERLLRLNGREETIHGRRVDEVRAILEPDTAPAVS